TPFLAMRDFHALRHGTDANFSTEVHGHHVSIRQNNNELKLFCDAGPFVEGRDWWRGHFYAIDAERGQDCMEDLFVPGRFVFQITQPQTVMLVASVGADTAVDWAEELLKRETRRVAAPGSSRSIQKLQRAADDYVVARKSPDGS